MSAAQGSGRRYLAFDIEITKIIPQDAQDWNIYRPFGISCAATLTDDMKVVLWYGKTEEGNYAPQMNRWELLKLVTHLQNAVDAGYQILTWNGLGFDFDVLAEESGEYPICRELALDHIDMMFHVFCLKGFPLGLDRAAKGMNLQGKLEGMSGWQAPILWQQGQYQKVLDYVSQDVALTLKLFLAGQKTQRLSWVSKSGGLQDLYLPQGWLNVRQAMQLPEPDTSWMKNPMRRSRFTAWMGRAGY